MDAVILVQYAGLNPMGGRARAGCPIRNIQSVLNSVTGVGLSVAVFEEVNAVEVAGKAGTGRVWLVIESRRLLLIVFTG